jgi:ketosteroid isomerase-like protein
MRSRELVRDWVEAFNRGDAEAIAAFYHEDAVNPLSPARLRLLPCPGRQDRLPARLLG